MNDKRKKEEGNKKVRENERVKASEKERERKQIERNGKRNKREK